MLIPSRVQAVPVYAARYHYGGGLSTTYRALIGSPVEGFTTLSEVGRRLSLGGVAKYHPPL